MFFSEVIGQTEAKQHLLTLVREDRIPHAMLFTGKEGTGKMPLALAFARYLCCEHPGPDDACGHCPSCVKMARYVHPDLHFAFPVIKRKSLRDVVCDDYISEWRDMLAENPYFSLPEWLSRMGTENQQAQIYVKESDEIQRKLSLKSSQGGYKIMIVWLPEKMNAECGNKLLKLIEEPPSQTLFLLVTEAADAVLPTLVSRTQRFHLPPLEEREIAEMLRSRYMLQTEDAENIAHRSGGSVSRAVGSIRLDEDSKLFLDLFIRLMRLSYMRDVRGMKQWSEEVAGAGRERQKNFLDYCQRMVRENFVNNLRRPEVVYMGLEEARFASRFSPFVSERNVMDIMNELALAGRHVEQNVNAKFVFFDLILKMTVLLLRH